MGDIKDQRDRRAIIWGTLITRGEVSEQKQRRRLLLHSHSHSYTPHTCANVGAERGRRRFFSIPLVSRPMES